MRPQSSMSSACAASSSAGATLGALPPPRLARRLPPAAPAPPAFSLSDEQPPLPLPGSPFRPRLHPAPLRLDAGRGAGPGRSPSAGRSASSEAPSVRHSPPAPAALRTKQAPALVQV